MLGFDLSTIWAGLIAFAVLTYVVLDGFDLGVGILFPFAKDEKERDVMMNSVAPIWDGNETWLVLGGGGLFAVFPLAYSIVMPALYMPIIAMLLGLIFRGVAFEYRWRTVRWKRLWDYAFFGGSLMAGVCQGLALGGLVQGIEVQGRSYAGGTWDWLTPFSVLVGLAVPTGYALLGATWLNMKLVGRVQQHMRSLAQPFGVATLLFMGAVSLATPFQNDAYLNRWFGWPMEIWTVIVPLLVLLVVWRGRKGLVRGDDVAPFLCALSLFVLAFIGIGISFFPMMVPPTLTIAEAAAPESSLYFALVGTLVMVPIILAYSGYSYWVFRGKIDPEEGYH
ncbi:cytochrome d ubiquinol oxidase subunit II [Falsirhodobacter sp. alg1]|uniref:cytochrome d ubiquinol oxidase subunit II n=1 Tax=Falsirhodobacter sp. alg1 TaxID=1472418 RepID=UPI0005F07F79|nr:cytochrome d ubiquinol oxidase subunit II [Falsirhodobacter sp. alg1]